MNLIGFLICIIDFNSKDFIVDVSGFIIDLFNIDITFFSNDFYNFNGIKNFNVLSNKSNNFNKIVSNMSLERLK